MASNIPVIDLTSRESPRLPSSTSSSSDDDGPLVATTASSSRNNNTNVTAAASTSASTSAAGSVGSLPRRPLPYPTNAASTPIDLTDDDIEYLGEHRLQLPYPHGTGNDARPVSGDDYNLLNRLSRQQHASRGTASGNSSRQGSANLRVIDEDPLRFGAAGPGPAAVAAANARLRRSAAAPLGGEITNSQATNNNNGPPPAGLNARRNRQRAQNAHNANNNHGRAVNANVNAQDNDELNDHYYRRVPPPQHIAPPPRQQQARGGARARHAAHAQIGMFAGAGDQWEDLDMHWPMEQIMNGAFLQRNGLQQILQQLGIAGHAFNAQPAHHNYNARRKVKAYSVKQSHPAFNKKKDGKDGFEREIVPPPELEEQEKEVEEKTEEEVKTKAGDEEMATAPDESQGETDKTTNAKVGEDAGSSINQVSSNKGKGRAVEHDDLDTTMRLTHYPDGDIPILDLDTDSPHTAGSTGSSAFSSAIATNSTRATSIDAVDNHKPDEQVANQTAPAPAPPPKPTTRSIVAPVCTSCSLPLWLNQSAPGRPYILVCGHVVCRVCLDTATKRYLRWTATDADLIESETEEGESLPPLAVPTWKGTRVKETFEEVNTRASTAAKDRKGKKKAKDQDQDEVVDAQAEEAASGNVNARTATRQNQPASTSQARQYTTRTGRRTAGSKPDYRDADDDPTEGGDLAEDGSYLPRSTRAETSSTSPELSENDDDNKTHSRDKGKGKARAGVQHKRKTKAELDEEEDVAMGLISGSSKPKITGKSAEDDEKGESASQKSKLKGKGKSKSKGKGKGTARIEDTDEEEEGELHPTEEPAAEAAAAASQSKKRKRGKKDIEEESLKSTTTIGTTSKPTAAAKTVQSKKKHKIERPPLIDPHWLTCPVSECKGGTDLGKPIGSREGAWEMFV